MIWVLGEQLNIGLFKLAQSQARLQDIQKFIKYRPFPGVAISFAPDESGLLVAGYPHGGLPQLNGPLAPGTLVQELL